MAVQVLIVHGTFGHPEEHWLGWMKKKLVDEGIHVISPAFPTPEHQSLANWQDIIDQEGIILNEQTIVIGHSLGVAFLLSLLEQQDQKIQAAFFVSGFVSLLGNKQFDTLNKTFVQKKFDWEKIRKNCSHFFLFHGDNDPYVPQDCAIELAERLETEVRWIQKGGHINGEAGFEQFELLFEMLYAYIHSKERIA